MYGIFTYIWVFFGENVGKYTMHWASGIDSLIFFDCPQLGVVELLPCSTLENEAKL